MTLISLFLNSALSRTSSVHTAIQPSPQQSGVNCWHPYNRLNTAAWGSVYIYTPRQQTLYTGLSSSGHLQTTRFYTKAWAQAYTPTQLLYTAAWAPAYTIWQQTRHSSRALMYTLRQQTLHSSLDLTYPLKHQTLHSRLGTNEHT